ncbi:putative baseplate assembly protein [Angustibacter sp. McL0619]|uniref:putative baseplate assembly protein n=1 Tax=Angustibacter sp. McL0619 TaxID=3415676 RepID=UPI003CECB7AD
MVDEPRLDDRRFQDLVDDARRILGSRVAGAGPAGEESALALIEAAALMVDQLLFRVNQLPSRMQASLVELIGIHPYPARAAQTVMNFWTSTGLADDLVIPSATQVSVPHGPTFTTRRALRLAAVHSTRVLVRRAGVDLELSAQQAVDDVPSVGDALLVALSDPAPHCMVKLDVTCSEGPVGVDPMSPPLTWEATVGDQWLPCELLLDETGGLARSGSVVVHLPREHHQQVIADHQAAWVRGRITEPEPGMPPYLRFPVVSAVEAATVGGSIEAVHGFVVPEELLGTSSGQPGQSFRMRAPTAIDPDDTVIVEVFEHDSWVTWRLVSSFADSAANDRVVHLAAGNGLLLFGPSVRQPDGSIQQYGAVPVEGALVRIRNHLVGGGRAGNVAQGMITVLETSIPYISRVDNPVRAIGGHDAESAEEVRRRIPLTLRSRGRAVTSDDFEYLAREAAPELARVHCIANESAGSATVLVVPWIVEGSGRMAFLDLVPDQVLLERVRDYLDDRRIVGTRLLVEPPVYHGVTIVAMIRGTNQVRPEILRDAALEALYGYYHPTRGGPAGDGWPFGRPVVLGEVFAVLQRVPGVDVVEDVALFPADPRTGHRGESTQRIELGRGSLVFSFEHQIKVVGP